MACPRGASHSFVTMMDRLRAATIVAIFLIFTFLCMPIQWLLLNLGSRRARTFPHWYHRQVANLFGLRIRLVGTPIRDEGVLIVANHTSWADIVIFSAVMPISFVSKAEVARWPLFGTLARLQRTVFVDRRPQSTGNQRDEIAQRLADGDNLILFPEGTSDDGNRILPFYSALLGVAERRLPGGGPVPVQPVSIGYSELN